MVQDEAVSTIKSSRLLIVKERDRWFVRRVAVSVHDGDADMMVYKCDEYVGGPFMLLGTAVDCARAAGAR